MAQVIWRAILSDQEYEKAEGLKLDQAVDELELAWERIKQDFLDGG